MKSLPLAATAALIVSAAVASASPVAATPLVRSPLVQCPPGPPPPPPPPKDGPGGGPTTPGSSGPGAGPTQPGPSSPGPAAGAPAAGPATSGPARGRAPAPGPASSPGPRGAGPATLPRSASSPRSIGAFSQDSLHWSHWWYLESARFLDIRKNIQGPLALDGRTVATTAPRAPSRSMVQTRVIPRLIEIVDKERSDPVVAAALVSLGRIADEPAKLHDQAVDSVQRHLNSPSLFVRESAIIALGLFGTERCNRALIELAGNSEKGQRLIGSNRVTLRTRAFAAHALGLAAVRSKSVHEQQRIALCMLDVLEGDVVGMVDLPVAAVSTLGLVTLPSRISIPLEEHRGHGQVDHVLSTGHLAKYLLPLTQRDTSARADRSVTFRAHACVALARAARGAGPERRAESIERLIALGSSPSEHLNVRTSASIALGEVASAGEAPADVNAREHLVHMAQDGQPLERRFAWIAAAATMARSGAGEDPMAGSREIRKALAREINRGKSGELGWAALALGMLEDSLHEHDLETSSSARDVLESIAKKKRSDDDSAALGLGLALATRHTGRARRAASRLVIELEQTSTPELRGNLLLALGLAEFDGAAGVFRTELQRSRNQPVLLWSAAVGLGLLGEPVSIDLVRMLKRAKSSTELVGISAALGQVGTSNAVMPLLELVHQDSRPAPMRAVAIEALGSICDLDRLPWRDPLAHALPFFASTPTLSTNGVGLLERAW